MGDSVGEHRPLSRIPSNVLTRVCLHRCGACADFTLKPAALIKTNPTQWCARRRRLWADFGRRGVEVGVGGHGIPLELVPSHWRDCHFADALSPSILKLRLKVEGGVAE